MSEIKENVNYYEIGIRPKFRLVELPGGYGLEVKRCFRWWAVKKPQYRGETALLSDTRAGVHRMLKRIMAGELKIDWRNCIK